jgi:hypothetical protein
MDDSLWAWNKLFMNICDEHAKPKISKVRSYSHPWINSNIRMKMNRRFKLFKKAITTKDDETWKAYKWIRNKITSDVRSAKEKYFKQ